MRTRLFYIDDSGAGDTGYIVFSWIECDITAWRKVLHTWLELRRDLFARYQIPPAYELHATQFINGRGRPSTDPGWNRSKANRVAAAKLAIEAIAACPDLRVGTVYRRFAKPRELGVAKAGLYHALIARLDDRLTSDDDLGLVFMDGDGTDPTYDAAHRALSLRTRHIIEDPLFRVSHRSQWVQMADLVAYCAYQSLLRHPAKRLLWDWYDEHLADRDAGRGPVAL